MGQDIEKALKHRKMNANECDRSVQVVYAEDLPQNEA